MKYLISFHAIVVILCFLKGAACIGAKKSVSVYNGPSPKAGSFFPVSSNQDFDLMSDPDPEEENLANKTTIVPKLKFSGSVSSGHSTSRSNQNASSSSNFSISRHSQAKKETNKSEMDRVAAAILEKRMKTQTSFGVAKSRASSIKTVSSTSNKPSSAGVKDPTTQAQQAQHHAFVIPQDQNRNEESADSDDGGSYSEDEELQSNLKSASTVRPFGGFFRPEIR